MEELVAKGSVKAIGISNFTITKTENLLKTAKIVPAVNQGNLTVIDGDAWHDINFRRNWGWATGGTCLS